MSTIYALTQAMKSIPWFRGLKPEHFDSLAKIARLEIVEEGVELFREGDKQDFFYIVVEGRVALEIFVPHRGRVRILTAEPLDIVGWSSVTPIVRQRTASAMVVVRSKLLALDAEALRQLCEEDYELGYIIMRRLTNIIASRLLITRLQLLDMFTSPSMETKHAQ